MIKDENKRLPQGRLRWLGFEYLNFGQIGGQSITIYIQLETL